MSLTSDKGSNRKCLVLEFLAFLWAELSTEAKEDKEEQTCRLLGKFDLNGYVDAENHSLVIGGLFPIHSRTIPANESTLEPVSAKSEGFNFRRFRWMKAMSHMIMQINKRKDILPNITLGYQIFDTCFTISKSVEAVLVFLTGQEENRPNFRNSTGAFPAVIVGAGASSLSVAASRILGLYYLPQVGYASTCVILSDKYQFPSYLHVIASDKIQSKAMVKHIQHFHFLMLYIVGPQYTVLHEKEDVILCICMVQRMLVLLKIDRKIVEDIKFADGLDLEVFYIKQLEVNTNNDLSHNGKLSLVVGEKVDLSGRGGPYRQLSHSVCTDVCPPGTRKGIRQGEPICCFDSIPCADGHVSRKPGERECEQCDEDYWSNAQKSECVLKEVEYLAYDEALGFTLVILSVFGAFVVLAVTTVYVIHRHTPLVNASDRQLSFLVQVSLIITLLSSMLFIDKPNNWSCMAGQVTLALGFSLCLSCLLGKTSSLFLAYRISKSRTQLTSMRPLYRKIIVLISVLVEIGICTAYSVLEPPMVYKNMEPQNTKIILGCNEVSIEFLYSMFGIDAFLALLCFLTTFVARQLPDNYYEEKCVTFEMLVFFVIWISFVPAYLSTKGKFKVAVEIFAILASSYVLLGCIFAPKCLIILLRPQRNASEIVSGRVSTTDNSIQLTSASVSSELNNTTVSAVLDD
ncbi:LOW QUALITY PROTEIN: vomeronasal type-2 receptor 1-like [Hylobates moloch]|uniref:LOW QUALITY PROTEIN: vomeronasal type-2 receptor 1-like n=1 Tax=Hylobates moloch TaxID=81572 RepID=UPI0026748B3D|nr:LOW QUALITY PROTEIN: vomeronasal type-2 receptor 1-like [Hylobates moloch]